MYYTRAKKFADELGTPYLETSAKNGRFFEEILLTIVAEMKKKEEDERDEVDDDD